MSAACRLGILCTDLVKYGGAERLLFEEAEYFRQQGWQVTVATLEFDPDVTFGGFYRVPIEIVRPRHLISGCGEVGRYLNEAAGVLHWLQRARPDAVIALSPNDCALLLFPAILTRTPYVTHVNGTLFWFPPNMDVNKYALLYRRALRRVLAVSPGHAEFIPLLPPPMTLRRRVRIEATALLHWLAVRTARQRISLSRRMAWEVETLYGKPTRAIKGAFPGSILHYSPKTDPLSRYRSEGGPVVLNINRLDPRKRIDLAIRAFRHVLPRSPQATLVIGGQGPAYVEDALRALVKDLRLEERVHFAGFVPESDLWDWLSSCDVFIHMNWAEFAIAPYEALALGKKVVWSKEMEVDAPVMATGLLYPAEPNVDDTAKQLLTALEAPMPEPAARQPMAEYTWDRYFEKLALAVTEAIPACNPRVA